MNIDYLSLFKHLLPKGRAWALLAGKTITKFFDALKVIIEDARGYFDTVYDSRFPAFTDSISEWLSEFNLISSGDEAIDRQSLAGAWRLNEYQSPKVIQDTLQAAGFDLYVYEWWLDGSNPPIPKNPFQYLGGSIFYTTRCGGSSARCGNPEARCGNGDEANGDVLVNKTGLPQVNIIPQDQDKWPYFMYIGSANFPVQADIPAARKNELETLLLKICPSEQWIGLMINFV